jgi:hypothetical protein
MILIYIRNMAWEDGFTGQNSFIQDSPLFILQLLPYPIRANQTHQFSHTRSGNTVLISAQWPNALFSCHGLNISVLFFSSKTSSPSPVNTFPNESSVTSCCGSKNICLAPLPNQSFSLGFRKVIAEGELVQKMTMLVKSRLASVGAAVSR